VDNRVFILVKIFRMTICRARQTIIFSFILLPLSLV